MNLKESIQHNPEEFIGICKSFDIKSLYAFGSSLRDDFDEETSDVELLIEISAEDPISRGEQIMELWDRFEAFFKRKVDLLTSASLKNPFLRKSIEASKVLIYDGKELKISF